MAATAAQPSVTDVHGLVRVPREWHAPNEAFGLAGVVLFGALRRGDARLVDPCGIVGPERVQARRQA